MGYGCFLPRCTKMSSSQIEEKTREKNCTQKKLFVGSKHPPLECSNKFNFFFFFGVIFFFFFFHWFSYLVLVLFCYCRHPTLFQPISKLLGLNDEKSNRFQNDQHCVWSSMRMKTLRVTQYSRSPRPTVK